MTGNVAVRKHARRRPAAKFVRAGFPAPIVFEDLTSNRPLVEALNEIIEDPAAETLMEIFAVVYLNEPGYQRTQRLNDIADDLAETFDGPPEQYRIYVRGVASTFEKAIARANTIPTLGD